MHRVVLMASTAVLCCGHAAAHSPVPGIGHFYNGALHPYTTPAHLIALLALGLLLGQRGLKTSSTALVALLFALALGLGLSTPLGHPDTDTALLALAAATGLAVVCALALTRWPLVFLAATLGLLLGLGSGPEALAGGARWGTMFGTLVGAAFCTAYVAPLVAMVQKPALRIGVRVAGSWLAASALLVLALALRTR